LSSRRARARSCELIVSLERGDVFSVSQLQESL
jgi:hypothetical protein